MEPSPSKKLKSAANVLDSSGRPFVAKSLVPTVVGKETLQLYPTITSDMSIAEKSHAFQTNRTNVECSGLDDRNKLSIMGRIHKSEAIVNITQAELTIKSTAIMDPTNMTVLSYHTKSGDAIDNCIDPDTNQLKTLQNGAVAACRPDGIMYAKVNSTLDFSSYDPINCPSLQVPFYIRLPTSDINLTLAGRAKNMHTYIGDPNWLNPESFQDDILNHPEAINKPFALEAAVFGTLAATNTDVKKKEIADKVREISVPIIYSKIFAQLCPNYADDPSSTITNIRQQYTDEMGQTHTMSVDDYYQAILNCMLTFDQSAPYPVDVHRIFCGNLAPMFKDELEKTYKAHLTTQSQNAYHQLTILGDAHRAATVAEKSIHNTMQIVQLSNANAHGFLSFPVFQSPAERALAEHRASSSSPSGNDTSRQDKVCWGCSGNHTWWDRIKKVVSCPNKDQPGVQAAADAKFTEHKKKVSDRRKNNRKRGNNSQMAHFFDMMSPPDKESDLSAADKAESARAFFQSMWGQSNGTASKQSKTSANSAVRHHTFISVLSTNTNQRPMLPIPLSTNLPHIALGLGLPDSDFQPKTMAILDTAAALSTGNADYHLKIAETYPQLVKSIIWAKDQYSPISLSGVVKDQETAQQFVTELPAVIEYHLPYHTADGSPTSLKIAIGKHVAVNLILGLTFLQSTNTQIDLNDNVADCKLLSSEPFDIILMSPACGLPRTLPLDGDHANNVLVQSELSTQLKLCRAFIQDVDEVKRSAAINADIEHDSPKTDSIEKSVTFDIRPEKQSAPIRVTRRKKGRKRPNLYDDRGMPDPRDDFDFIMKQEVGPIIRRRKCKPRALDDIDPTFLLDYNEHTHGDELRKNLTLDPALPPWVRSELLALIKEFWCCFCEEKVIIHVRDYKCCIDTGTAKPIAVKNLRYGPHESKVISAACKKLESLGQIRRTFTGQWLSKGLLAPKPHQECIVQIDDFEWRFCVNYIPLNQVTLVIAFPIPRCDDAVEYGFGKAKLYMIMDAYSGFHQIAMDDTSAEKTGFAAPNGEKYEYTVMPFGIVNGPTTYIVMKHDMKAVWDERAITSGIPINDNNNSKIIVDDLFSYVETYRIGLAYLRQILMTTRTQNLSWKLSKCKFFPKSVEFVGHDLSFDGNRPSASKIPTLQTWPLPTDVRDVAGFIGFGSFYSKYIPYFEDRISHLRELTKLPYDTPLAPSDLTSDILAEYEDIKQALLSAPCLRRHDTGKRNYLRTDFSAKGMGYALLQPEDTDEAISAMNREIAGGPCEFDIKMSSPRLFAVSFGARRNRGYEKFLHSHLGEGFGLDWGANKNRHFLWGQRFTAISDCYGLKFIMSYDKNNPVILRLQMRLMLWDFTIQHRVNAMMHDADFFSRMGADTTIDPLLQTHIGYASSMAKRYPSPSGEMIPETMPGFRGTRTLPDITSNLSTATTSPPSNPCLENIPILFGSSDTISPAEATPLLNNDIPSIAYQITKFHWALYGFNSGHFASTCRSNTIPFNVIVAADTNFHRRSLIKDQLTCPTILDSADALLKYADTTSAPIHGFWITGPDIMVKKEQTLFLRTQATILHAFQQNSNLHIFVLHLPSCFQSSITSQFITNCNKSGWHIFQENLAFPFMGDCVDDNAKFIIGVQKAVAFDKPDFSIPRPPVLPSPFAPHIYTPYNRVEYSISDQPGSALFESDSSYFDQVKPDPIVATQHTNHIQYHLVPKTISTPTLAGSQVCDSAFPAPKLNPPNFNIFGYLFGIAFEIDGRKLIRPFSPYEYVNCLGYDKSLTRALAQQPQHIALLANAIPAKTSFAILSSIFDLLLTIRHNNSEIFDTSPHAAPAATVQALVNGAVGIQMPTRETWIDAYKRDAMCCAIMDIIANPALVTKKSLEQIHYVYRQPLRNSAVVNENGILFIKERLVDSGNYVKLQIVPSELQIVVFTAFHANPIGAHFSVYRTYARIRLRYFWPGYFTYIKTMCARCAGCNLANSIHNKSSELTYSFPIDAPFRVIHADAWTLGTDLSFSGDKSFMIVNCGMTAYVATEPLKEMNAKTFAAAIVTIMLREGFCHTIVVDKDSKFANVFIDAGKLLKIHVHVASGGNHDPILCERFNRFLNRAMRIFSNERNTNRSVTEGVHLTAFAWNSAPVVGTDISRSLIVKGREFQFPIDYSSDEYTRLTSTPEAVTNYAKTLAELLACCQDVAKILIDEHRAWHREYRNSQLPDPKIFQIGDRVFARRSVRSDKKKGRVGKTQYAHTGPWEIIEKLAGGSYKLQHCLSKQLNKKHTSDLSPCPRDLVPFTPIHGADNSFGQINKQIQPKSYLDAGIDGFPPASPFKVHVTFAQYSGNSHTHLEPFPSLSELDDELSGRPTTDDICTAKEDHHSHIMDIYTGILAPASSLNNIVETRDLSSVPSPKMKTQDIPAKTFSQLIVDIVQSDDKLIFIAYKSESSTYREWHLVQINLASTMSQHPSAMQDGKFLVEFLIAHPSDSKFNEPNKRYWTEFHHCFGSYKLHEQYHLVKPTIDRPAYCRKHSLVPFSQWIQLDHSDVLIHGPFNFASINGRKTRDRVSLVDWQILARSSALYDNSKPNITLSALSVHLDTAQFSQHTDTAVSKRVQAFLFSQHFAA